LRSRGFFPHSQRTLVSPWQPSLFFTTFKGPKEIVVFGNDCSSLALDCPLYFSKSIINLILWNLHASSLNIINNCNSHFRIHKSQISKHIRI
jgi:hypothetical protein